MVSKNCEYCNQGSYMLFPCKICGKSFCSAHRLPENHGCGASSRNITANEGYTYAQSPGASYLDQDERVAQSIAQQSQQPREYVWEPKITELPDDPFNPASGVILKGVFWARGKELFHVLIAFAIMFMIGMMMFQGAFQGTIPGFEDQEKIMFPFYLASMSTAGFLIHEFSHRQVGRRYKLPAKFRLLTIGMLITVIGIVLYFIAGFPPFAVPGAVVVIGLENKDQTGKCKAAGPISNLIIASCLITVSMLVGYYGIGFEWFILFSLGANINAFLGFFNMIPVGLLDGYAIIKYKKWLWFILFFSLLALLLFEMVFVMGSTDAIMYWYRLFYP